MIQAKGHGQSECCECKKQGKYSLTWTSFLYRIKNDNYKNLYCYKCAKKLEKSMNDIEILEDYVKLCKRTGMDKERALSIENLLKRNKELEYKYEKALDDLVKLEKSDKSKEESSMKYYNETKALQEDLDKAWEEWNNLDRYYQQEIKKYIEKIKELETKNKELDKLLKTS